MKRTDEKMRVLIVMPAYNEAGSLPSLIQKAEKACEYCDLLVINDCSQDDTSEVCAALDCQVIDLPVNLGIGGAVQTGIKYAYDHGYDAVVQVDGDGQHDPGYIPLLLEKLNGGADACIGSRFLEREGFQSTGVRRAAIRFFSGLLKILTGKRFTDPTSGFRAFGKKAIEYFSADYPKDYPEPEAIVMLEREGLKVEEIPVKMFDREHGRSSITFIKSTYYMLKVTLSVVISSISKRR
jgi:glycosyltransferase involved in cell wall biosynthesis